MAQPINVATVYHHTRDHVVITPQKGYSVTTFNLTDGNVEAFVASDDGSETIRLLVAGPTMEQTMTITTDPESGVVDIVYSPSPLIFAPQEA